MPPDERCIALKTKLFKITSPDDKAIDEAARIIRSGGLVAMPTETVYGLAANALDPQAVANIFKAKGRPMDNPLIVHISRFEQIYDLVSSVPEQAKRLAEAYWPGPMTIILPKSGLIPDEVSAGLPTVAIRMPSHPIARALIERSGRPLAAPSANSSGLPSPTTAAHVMDDMDGRIDAVIDSGECSVGIESTVVTLATDPPRLLRPGGITHPQLERILGRVDIDPAVLSDLKAGDRPASPGMKYKHYSPRAQVFIVKGSLPSFKYQIDSDRREGDMCLCFDGEEKDIPVECLSFGGYGAQLDHARLLFADLRRFDELGAKRVFVRSPSCDGVGLGVYNRLLRAAAFRVLEPPAIYGLTGQSGAGKSTVAAELSQKGYLVIDCDVLARKTVEKGSPLLARLAEKFGSDIIEPDGSLNRALTAERAFANEESRLILNSITHPEITRLTVEQIKREYSGSYRGVVIDAAALLESDIRRYCEKIIVVTAPAGERLARIISRDGISRDSALKRINAQKPEQYYTERADLIIKNYGDRSLSDELKSL